MQDIKSKIKVVAAALAGGLMLGATMAGAVAADLGSLPTGFVSNNGWQAQIVVGQNAKVADVIAAAQISAAMAPYTVSASASGTTTSSGGRTEEVLLGKQLTYTGQFPTVLKTIHIPKLAEGKVTFKSKDYDYREDILLGSATMSTGQDDRDKDYDTTQPFLKINKGDIEYKLEFYGSSKPNVSKASTDEPLELSVLGHDIKIVGADASEGTLTIETGTQWNGAHVGDTKTVEGKTVTIVDIGSDSVAVDVSGVTKPVSKNTVATVNGLKVKVDSVIYHSNDPASSTAYLRVGTEVSKEYGSSDAFIGEDENDPNWVWDISLASDGTLSYIGVKNNKAYDNYKDNPPLPSGEFDLPNDYIAIKLGSTSPVADRDYTISFDTGIDLYNADGSSTMHTNANVLKVSTTDDNGLTDGTHNSREIALYFNNVYTGTFKNDTVEIYYKDGSKFKLANSVMIPTTSYNNTQWYLQYGDTIPYIKVMGDDANNFIRVLIDFDSITGATDVDGSVLINVNMNNDKDTGYFKALGTTPAQADANDVAIGDAGGTPTQVGTFDGSLLTHYGAVVKEVKTNADNDEVVVTIPNAQSKITVYVGAPTTTTTSTTGVSYTYAPITSEVAVLDSEANTNQPVIIVGGPYANSLAAQLIGTDDATIRTFFGADQGGLGVVKLYDSSETPWSQPAMLVAGWAAKDTRAAAYVLSEYLTGSRSLSELSGKTTIKVTASTPTSISNIEKE